MYFALWRFPRWIILLLVAVAILPWVLRPAVHGKPPGAIYSGDPRYPRLAIECNVDWGTQYIGPILAILKAKGIKITFFPTGRWVEQNPAEAKLLADAGMEIGSHGYRHLHVASLSLEANRGEMEKGVRLIQEVTGKRPNLYTPPYGELSNSVLEAASSLRLTTVMWSADTIDWRPSSSPQIIIARVLKKAGNGGIVLMHPTDRTVAALPDLLGELAKRGYQVTTVSNALGR